MVKTTRSKHFRNDLSILEVAVGETGNGSVAGRQTIHAVETSSSYNGTFHYPSSSCLNITT